MKLFNKIVGPDIRLLSGPLLVIILISAMFVYGFNIAYDTITDKIEEYKSSKAIERSLTAKREILENIELGSLEKSNLLLRVLPEENPASVAINQVKSLIQSNGLFLSKIEVTGESGYSENISSIKMNIEYISDNIANSVAFLEQLMLIAPIVKVSAAEIKSDENQQAITKVNSEIFWSTYPENIPPITEPINELTADENQKINNARRYKLPIYTSLPPTNPEVRENPFNF